MAQASDVLTELSRTNRAEEGSSLNAPPSTEAGGRSGLLLEWKLLSRSAKFFAVRAAMVASIGGLLFGYDIGVVEGALPQLREEMHLRREEADMVVAIMVAGAVVGSVMAGSLADRLGRWVTIVLTDLIFILGAIVLFVARHPETVFLGRFIVGVAVAISAVADVSYLAEVAPPSFRGAMVSTNEFAIAVGMLTAFLAGEVFKNTHDGWRIMFGLSALFAILQLVGMAFMPSSPRWLLSQGRHDEAKAVLTKIRSSPDEADAELRLLEHYEPGADGNIRDLLTKWRMPLVITSLLAFCQQLSGHSNVLNFNDDIFNKSGFHGPAPAVFLGVVKVFATVIAILLVDRVGRRPFLLWGAVAAMSSVLLLSLSFAVSSPGLSFAACCGLVAAYAVSFGPVTWLITAEMFPAGIRGRALGIGQVCSFMGNLVASSFFLSLLHAAGGAATFFLFAATIFIAIAFIFIFVPETKRKEPAQIAAEIPACGCCPTYTELADDVSPAEEAQAEGPPGRSDRSVELGADGANKWL